jgi:poly-gamma-glutamate capsule biosynthesis protein CapA/YwtB (metallophosphatase superfamily)
MTSFVHFFAFLSLGLTTWLAGGRPLPLAPPRPAPDSLLRVRITCVGDLMCHGPVFQYAKQADGSYDFGPMYDPVREYLASADFTLGNLETVLAGTTTDYSGYPQFNSPNSYADALKELGFDALFTTNNHSYDKFEAGLVRTLDELKKRRLPAVGTHYDQRDRDSVRLFSVKGIKIALLAYTEFSNIPVPAAKAYLVNQIDSALMARDIAAARRLGAELVLVNLHWGNEYQRFPNDYQKRTAALTFALGADIVFAEHPHVLQPVQLAKLPALAQGFRPGLDSGLVAYSLGNFISNQQKRFTDAGVMLSLIVEKNLRTGKKRIAGVEHVPTWVYKGPAGGRNRFIIFPAFAGYAGQFPSFMQYLVPNELVYLSPEARSQAQQAYQDSKYILGQYYAQARSVPWASSPRLSLLVPPLVRERWRPVPLNSRPGAKVGK